MDGIFENCVVSSYTEWDPLEEVVVGVIDGGVFPTWQSSMIGTMPKESWPIFQTKGGSPFPREQVLAAQRELDNFAMTLENAGVVVTRPEQVDHARPFGTPDWQCNGGMYSAMPRDILMVIGKTIVEAPLSWRCRHQEINSFRPLIKDYFRRGASWLPAPRPVADESLYDHEYRSGDRRWSITEAEPVFDAADFVRFGPDILVQKSHVTNEFGISWLQRAIGPEFKIHTIEVNDPHAMHIDATIVPLAPGKVLVNPERYVAGNPLLRDWEVLIAPPPELPANWPLYFSSAWLSMNVLSLDESTVVVERQERTLISALEGWGFNCVPVDFRHVYTFGGSFHCVTLDVRRRGGPGRYIG